MAATKANSGHLSKRDLAAVLNYLAEIRHKWIDIGIQLELDPEELEKRANTNSAAGDNMRAMLLDWLKGEDPLPTWRALCSALRMPAVNETTIASVIERERVFVAVGSQTLSLKEAEAQDNDMESIGAVESAVRSEIADVDGTDPVDPSISVEPVTVREPFPHLISSGLSPEEKDVYLERLMLESMDIRYKFCRLASDTQISLLSRKVKIKRISDVVKEIHPHYHDTLFKYRAIDTPTAMGLLSDSWNFIFHSILEQIIVKLGTLEDQVNLEVYKRSLCEYSKRRLFECPDGCFGGSKKLDEEVMVMKRANKGTALYDTTLGDVQRIVKELQDEIKVEEFGMRLIGIGIEDHNMVFLFAVNSSLVLSESMFMFTQEKKERLMLCGIWHVSCREFIFQHAPQEQSEVDIAGVSDDEDQATKMEPPREHGGYNKDPATLELRRSMSYKDNDIGSHTHLSVNNIRQVVEVSNASDPDSPYKSYKVGRYQKGVLEWVSGTKGIRYGIGKYPKVVLNDEGYVVEVDEEVSGYISSRVGIVHPNNVMLWTEASAMTMAGSKPCIAVCGKAVVVTFMRNGNGYYCVGALDTGGRNVQWSKEEHKFITGGLTDLCIAINTKGQVAVVYIKPTLSAAVTPLYFIMGTLNHADQRISFSMEIASQSFAEAGTFPQVGLRDNSVLVVYAQKKSMAPKKIKYRIGLMEKTSTTHSYKVKWAVGKDTFDFSGERAAMAVNNKGVVIISHAQNKTYSCHIGRLYYETVI